MLPVLPGTVGLYVNNANVTGGGGGPINSGLYIDGWPQITSVGDAVGNTNTFTFVIWGGGPSLTYHVKIDYGANTTTVSMNLYIRLPLSSMARHMSPCVRPAK